MLPQSHDTKIDRHAGLTHAHGNIQAKENHYFWVLNVPGQCES